MRIFYIGLIFLFIHAMHGQGIADLLDEATELYQQKRYDEAITLLNSTIINQDGKTNTDLVNLYNLLAKNQMHAWSSDKALDSYSKAWELSKSIDDERLQIETAFALSTLLGYNQKQDSVKIILDELLAFETLDDKDKSDIYMQLSHYYEGKELLDSSIHFASQAAFLDSIHQDSSSIPFTFYDLGNYYVGKGDYEKAISKILYGLNYIRGEKDHYKRDAIELGLSDIYLKIGNIFQAEALASQVATNSKNKGYHINLTNAYNALGNCADFKGEHELALKYYIKADSVNRSKSGNTWRSVRAQSSAIKQKLNLGEKVTNEDLEFINSIREEDTNNYTWTNIQLLKLRLGNHSNKKFQEEYDRLYSSLGAESNLGLRQELLRIKKEYLKDNERYREALSVEDELDEIRKQIAASNNSYIIQELEAKHRKKEQELRIGYLDKQNEEKAKTLSQQKSKILTRSIALGFITLLSFFLYRLYLKVRKQKSIISKALTEKDLLLREIHHRVKNNLQLVSSMLTLQGKSIDDKIAAQAIQDGKSRVRSMALIHQDLYNKDNLTDIGVKNYVENLAEELFRTYGVDEDRVEPKMKVEDIDLDIDTLIPLGLIINELVTNSIKYAWPQERRGQLEIILQESGTGLELQVNDDGVGYDAKEVRNNSFGMTLVKALSKQLDGDLQINSEIGTRTRLVIK